MEKGSKHFKVTLQSYLDKVAEKNILFAKTMKKEGKNIDDCITYILNTVKKTGASGFADAEIYGMALHYYDEEQIDIGEKIEAQGIVNHHVELTEEEKAELKEEAKKNLLDKEYARLTAKPKVAVVKKEDKVDDLPQQSLF